MSALTANLKRYRNSHPKSLQSMTHRLSRSAKKSEKTGQVRTLPALKFHRVFWAPSSTHNSKSWVRTIRRSHSKAWMAHPWILILTVTLFLAREVNCMESPLWKRLWLWVNLSDRTVKFKSNLWKRVLTRLQFHQRKLTIRKRLPSLRLIKLPTIQVRSSLVRPQFKPDADLSCLKTVTAPILIMMIVRLASVSNMRGSNLSEPI